MIVTNHGIVFSLENLDSGGVVMSTYTIPVKCVMKNGGVVSMSMRKCETLLTLIEQAEATLDDQPVPYLCGVYAAAQPSRRPSFEKIPPVPTNPK